MTTRDPAATPATRHPSGTHGLPGSSWRRGPAADQQETALLRGAGAEPVTRALPGAEPATSAIAGTGAEPATTVLPIVPGPAQHGGTPPAGPPPRLPVTPPPLPVPPQARPNLAERFLSPALALAAVALLPLAAATTDLSALDGWGLAKVLGPAAWAALLCAVGACLAELFSRRARIPMLATATGVLILCSTGLPSVIQPAARFGTAWTIVGFVDAVAVQDGVPPVGLDARFWWPAFFAQWAWFRQAAGVDNLDVVLRWFPPLVVAVWATGIYALARSMLGGTRAPWAAAWLFVGLNWIEQDYFSPQAIGIVLLLTVLTFALGPLATRRTDPSGVPGWPAPRPGARRLPLLHRWLVGAMTPPNRPTLPPRQLLLVYFCAALCILAVIPAHQLTPFALLGQLALLAVVGRFRGRGLVLLGFIGVAVFILISGRDFWMTQLGMLIGTGDSSAALEAGVADRLAGDTGQIAVKYLRVLVPGLTYLLGIAGAYVYWRRRRDLVPIGLAVVPMAFAAQGYGGEVFLRIVLFGLPILVILGTDMLRALVRWKRWMRVVLAFGMVATFAMLILIRGGNDAYQVVYPKEVELYRVVAATTPADQVVVPLGDPGPTAVEGLVKYGRGSLKDCVEDTEPDPVGCVNTAAPDVIVSYTSVEKQGVYLYSRPQGWSLDLANRLVADGRYVMWYQDGYDFILRKAESPVLPGAVPPAAPLTGSP